MSRNQWLAVGILVTLASFAQGEQILLSDGSRIQGKILSMENGTYTVQTESMGVIRLSQQQIQSISAHGASQNDATTSGGAGVGQSTIQSIQSSMTSNPGIMSMIMSLQNDPDMQAVLNDPEVMAAINSFDLEKLKNHPKIIKLMQNRQIQNIQGKVN